MEIVRMGETAHAPDFCVLREHGHPVYLLLLTETPARFEVDGRWQDVPAGTAFLFRPGQRHSYRAAGGGYADCWMHIAGEPLLFADFPFGKPVPLRAPERFFGLFRLLLGEFFAVRRLRGGIVADLASALLHMVASEAEVRGPLFYEFLSLRESIFREPAACRRAADAARALGVSCGYFHALYKEFFQTTFTADVIAARIQAAEELLLSTRASVGRIAEGCGYENVEHFIRQFCRATGTTPARFREGGGRRP